MFFSRFVRAKDRTWLSAIYTVNAHCACQILIKQPLFTGRKYTNELCFRLDTLETSLFSSCLVGMENYFTLHINTTTHSKCSGRGIFMGLKCKCNVLWCKWMYLKSAKQALFSTSFWFTFGNLHCCTAFFFAVERRKIKMKEKKFYSWLGIKYEVQLFWCMFQWDFFVFRTKNHAQKCK